MANSCDFSLNNYFSKVNCTDYLHKNRNRNYCPLYKVFLIYECKLCVIVAHVVDSYSSDHLNPQQSGEYTANLIINNVSKNLLNLNQNVWLISR